MKKVTYEVKIQCPKEKVFSVMLDQEHYRAWTAVFAPGSRYEGKWEEGSNIKFLAETKEGGTGGMTSLVERLIPNELVRIKHLAMFDGEKQNTFEDSDFYEIYHFTEDGKGTLLMVELDTEEEWESYFDKTFPEALKVLKKICERDC